MMAQVLERAELAKRHRMTDMDVGGGGVDAKLDIQGLIALQLLDEQLLRLDFENAGLDDSQLFFRCKHRIPFILIRRCIISSCTAG